MSRSAVDRPSQSLNCSLEVTIDGRAATSASSAPSRHAPNACSNERQRAGLLRRFAAHGADRSVARRLRRRDAVSNSACVAARRASGAGRHSMRVRAHAHRRGRCTRGHDPGIVDRVGSDRPRRCRVMPRTSKMSAKSALEPRLEREVDGIASVVRQTRAARSTPRPAGTSSGTRWTCRRGASTASSSSEMSGFVRSTDEQSLFVANRRARAAAAARRRAAARARRGSGCPRGRGPARRGRRHDVAVAIEHGEGVAVLEDARAVVDAR